MPTYDELKRQVTVEFIASTLSGTSLSLTCEDTYQSSVRTERCARFLDKAKLDFIRKEQLFEIIKANEKKPVGVFRELVRRKEDMNLCEALIEILEND